MLLAEILHRIVIYANIMINKEPDKTIRPFKQKAYTGLYEKIKNEFSQQPINEDISYTDIINRIPLSQSMQDHLDELMKMPLGNANKKEIIINSLATINGIGNVLAEKLYTRGVRSIKELTSNKEIFNSLPLEAKLFLTHKPLQIIPREKIDDLIAFLKSHQILAKLKWIVVGSYRRKANFSHDIDIMIATNKDSIEVLNGIVNRLQKYTPFHVYSQGPDRVSGIIEFNHTALKLDFFITKTIYYPFMLLYSTGSKNHNLLMRRVAKNKGWLLNQKGLFNAKTKMPVTKKTIKTEKEIFKLLELDFLPPELR